MPVLQKLIRELKLRVLGRLSTRVFETRTATGREYFTCQYSGVSQIFVLIISNGEKILSNVNVVVWKDVKRENSWLPVAVRVSKTCVLKLIVGAASIGWLECGHFLNQSASSEKALDIKRAFDVDESFSMVPVIKVHFSFRVSRTFIVVILLIL